MYLKKKVIYTHHFEYKLNVVGKNECSFHLISLQLLYCIAELKGAKSRIQQLEELCATQKLEVR